MKTSTHYSSMLLTLGLLSTATSVYADDTEIFLKQAALTDEELRPNVVFLLDTSGSMGLPVNASDGTSSKQEEENYDPTVTYESSEFFSGGAGNDDYYYLYAKPNTYADQYIYYNKVHKDQLWDNGDSFDCDIDDDLTDAAPYTSRLAAYWDGTDANIESDSSADEMCRDYDEGCGFVKDATGPSGANGDWAYCGDDGVTVSTIEEVCTTTTTGGGGPMGGGGTTTTTCSDVTTTNTTYPGTELYFTSANFHNYLQNYYRYTVLETVLREVVDNSYDINLSFARFNGGNGGYIFQESVEAQDTTIQSALTDTINDIYEFDDSTPLTEALWEVYKYLDSDTADFGDNSGTNTPSAAYSSGTTYNSPIEYECQKNHVLVLTDGAPTSDTGRDSNIGTLTGSTCTGNCLDELAGWIHADGADDIKSDKGWGDSTSGIYVNTIGFGAATDAAQLALTASNGGGNYYEAANATALLDAFTTAISQAVFEKDTFVAPAVAVNSYSGLTHRDELYFALFQPSNSPRWAGNIKKYKLVDGEVVDSSTPAINAIDDSTGYFDSNALSYWSAKTDWNGDTNITADGADVEYGGFAYELSNPNTRNMYTYINGIRETVGDSTTNITTDLLGLGSSDATTEAARTEVLNWARGGTTANPNYYVGDIIHNRPSVVTYFQEESGDDVIFDDTVFAATNLGFLHGIDADEGEEAFSYIPEELLPNLTAYYLDSGTFSDKAYGLDAELVVWREDTNGNGNIVTSSGGNAAETDEHVYLYQAMRRGGTSIYALDATQRNNPTLLWQIDGTAYDTTPTGDFRDLAQTWSAPKLTSARWGCDTSTCTNERKVLFFGGGYDTVHDSATAITTGDKGNAIYMVDAETGDLLWSAGNGIHHDLNLSNMENSIPAGVTPVDINGDGYVDYLFAIDIVGNIWRIDFNKAATLLSNYAVGGKIADLSDTQGTGFRRFYSAISAAYFSDERGTEPFLTISVPSGYRASPNSLAADDYLFVIYDQYAFSTPVDEDGNPDYTYNGNQIIDFNDLGTTTTDYGWYFELTADGEKGLSKVVTFNGQIIMTTFIPASDGTCGNDSTGSGRYYVLDIFTGESSLTDDNDVGVNFIDLDHGGIPPEAAVIYTIKDGERKIVVCVGTECISDDDDDGGGGDGPPSLGADLSLKRTYWREN